MYAVLSHPFCGDLLQEVIAVPEIQNQDGLTRRASGWQAVLGEGAGSLGEGAGINCMLERLALGLKRYSLISGLPLTSHMMPDIP